MTEKIEALKKITFEVSAGLLENTTNLISDSVEWVHIIGLGKDGLSPFELKLLDKSVDDTLSFHIWKDSIHNFFGHILLPFLYPIPIPDSFYLTLKVKAVETASNREIVKQLAESTSCGCDCCGDHH